MPMVARSTVEDLVGRSFGRLTVLALLPSSNKYGATHWRCECDCGRIVVITDYHLRNLRGCGDQHCQHRPQRQKQSAPEGGDQHDAASKD